MKVVAVETVRLQRHPAQLFVLVQTDEGLVGLGETCLGAQAVEAQLHEAVAPRLLGQDPLRIVHHNREDYQDFLGFADAGVSARARSAIDIALWDLLGQACGQPLYQLFGGATRDSIPVYNSCAGPGYGSTSSNVDRAGNLPGRTEGGRYEDQVAVHDHPEELCRDLLAAGIDAIKVWPLDAAAAAEDGLLARPADIDAALAPLHRIRAAVGDRMRLLIDMHGLWRWPAAGEVVRALDELAPFWIEDPVKADALDVIGRVARVARAPLAMGETLATAPAYRRLFETGAVDVVMFDVGWVGGVTEALRVCTLADAYGLPVAPHDTTGPVVYTVGTHLCVSQPNALIQETVRAFYTGWYGDLVTELPTVTGGRAAPPTGPGLGTALHPDVRTRTDAVWRRSVA